MTKSDRDWAIETIVPDEVYTDREDFIDYFYHAALNAKRRRTISAALLGQRRMGKTEIFKRVVNRLFFEQDHTDPDAAVPVFYEFPDDEVSRKNFAIDYVENFIRWYAAFRLRDTELLSDSWKSYDLIAFVEKHLEISEGLHTALELLRAILEDGIVMQAKKAAKLPRQVAAIDDKTVVVFLDEFQNTRLPHHNFSVTGFFKEAVESPRCPHFVTGSAVSILADDMLCRGSLFGRFDYERIRAFSDYWGKELALRAAAYHDVEVSELMAPVVSDRCGGNPFYITAVIRQAAKQGRGIDDENTLNEILAVDVTSGFIWGELSDQVSRWTERINEHGIARWVLYLAATGEEGKDIDLRRIQEELYRRENISVSPEKVKDVLVKLARGDLIEYVSLDIFCRIKDPILNEFLKVWGRLAMERQNPDRVENEMLRKSQEMQNRFHEYKGYLAEVCMIQILWNGQGKTLPGKYFHSDADIVMPHRFFFIDQRHRPGAGENMEVDIHAAAGKDVWLAESKWWKRPVGCDVVENLLEQAEMMMQRDGKYLRTPRLWIFAYNGVTAKAAELIRKHGILWSSRAELDGLLKKVGLRKLPELEEKSG